MESREPKKGQGVPKETPARNSIGALVDVLARHFPAQDWTGLRAELMAHDYFALGMQAQERLLALVPARRLGSPRAARRLIPVLASSPVEKLQGLAALVVPLAYGDDVSGQLTRLRAVGALAGTWPRELAASVLHDLVIAHGVTAIRPRVAEWIHDPDPAVRRLVSEAFRPRWVMAPHIAELKRDPTPLKSLLAPLLDDPADYVRKSVANNLNDVSKDHPAQMLAWAREWLAGDAGPERRWVLERALRTLVGAGDRGALALLGYAPASALQLRWLPGTPAGIRVNQLLPFTLEISNLGRRRARVVVHLVMDEPGRGKARRRSQYQLWKGELARGETRAIAKHVHFVDRNSRPKEPGVYRFIPSVNGQAGAARKATFRRP